jgi:hypothetical protein
MHGFGLTKSLRPLVATAAALALWGGAGVTRAEAKILAQWVELGPDGASSARAITDAACPAVTFDGAVVPMGVRAEPTSPFGNVKAAQFPVRSCEVQVPAGAIGAMLDGKPLPLVRGAPRRILMFGDTGCRLLGSVMQACNDVSSWPFPKVAALAATTRPDLVIHVGDYHYRENPCATGNAGCAGSPWGYGWDVWNADFFTPAAPLLATAPWVLVRGNHENCDRAGEGWWRFLERLPMEAACRDFTGMFVARAGDFGVVVVDGARVTDEPKSDMAPVAMLRAQFRGILDKVPAEAWVATHQPPNAELDRHDATGQNFTSNKVLQASLGADIPAAVRMVVSGHIHFFQAIDFGAARPPQLVVGTGGDVLEPTPRMSAIGDEINGRRVLDSTTMSGFGFMVWDRMGAGLWAGTLFDVDGKPSSRCRLADRTLSCGQ